MENQNWSDVILAELQSLPTYQERIDIIAADIVSGRNDFKIVNDENGQLFYDLLTDKVLEEQEMRYWTSAWDWDSLSERICDDQHWLLDYMPDFSDERIAELIDLLDHDINLNDILSEGEKQLVVKAYEKFIEGDAESIQWTSRILILEATDGTELYFELEYADGYECGYHSPYNINAKTLEDRIEVCEIWPPPPNNRKWSL